jgi:hypothetical protein
MSFFARPNLENTQFKQLSGSTLTLEGQTQIATISGLTLTDGNPIPTNVLLTASGASFSTDGYVLTYCDTTKTISLAQSSASGGSTIYNCASPTTCAVGGLDVCTPIAGCNLSKIIEMMVAPVLYPILIPPNSSLSLSPTTTIFEIGCSIAFTGTINFNRGGVSPVYCGGTQYRTGIADCYVFTDMSGLQYSGVTNSCTMSSIIISSGNNTAFGVVDYSAGIAPTKSDGNLMSGCTCSADTISSCAVVCGIYPYFYGNSSSAPTAGSTLLTTGTNCIFDSSNSVVVNYNVTSKYIWLATPAISITKTKWEGSNAPTTNTESIPGGLFNVPTTVLVNSPSSCWSGINYKFYISNYPTSTIAGGTPYNITFKNN